MNKGIITLLVGLCIGGLALKLTTNIDAGNTYLPYMFLITVVYLIRVAFVISRK